MASKLFFLPMILATVLAVHLKADAQLPSIHVTNAVEGNDYPPVNIQIKAGGSLKGSAQLKPSQSYVIKVEVNNVYYASAQFGYNVTDFLAYMQARDKGQAAIYWKADNDGFAASYDNVNWKKTAPWVPGKQNDDVF